MTAPIVVGVDGGGTRSRLAAVRLDGTVTACAQCGGVNYNGIGMEAARRNLQEGLAQLLEKTQDAPIRAISVGMSALDRPADEALLRSFAGDCLDPQRLLMDSDVYMALMGATLGGPGVMVVSGTGAMVVAQDARGRVVSAGGWGHRLDDPGSAYGVAVDALRAALASLERAGEGTALSEAALTFFGVTDARELIARLYEEDMPPSRMAQFAQPALACAAQGDRVAGEILENHAGLLARLTVPLLADCPEGTDVHLYGGMFEHNPRYAQLFGEKLRALGCGAALKAPELPPQLGAVIAYFAGQGILTQAVVHRMRESWKEERI